MGKHICDCGRAFVDLDGPIMCANTNHGMPLKCPSCAAKDAEIAHLREHGIKAGEEIKHLRSCIVDQADNRLEITRLKELLGKAEGAIKRLIAPATMAEHSNAMQAAADILRQINEKMPCVTPARLLKSGGKQSTTTARG